MGETQQGLPAQYQAWVWREGHDAKSLTQVNRAVSPLADDEVLVANKVIGLNPVDWKVLGHLPWEPGHVPGVDGAGVVVATGKRVAPAWLGKRVVWHQSLLRHGSYAQFTPVQSRALMAIPGNLSFETAASFPCPGLTAWQAMSKLPLQAGQHLLIGGAGGAVGQYLVQLAVRAGWRVTALAHPRHHERLARLGAQRCFPNLRGEDELLPATLSRQFHGVIDAVSEQHAEKLVPALRANGHILCIQGRLPGWPLPAFGMAISMHEVALGALHTWGDDADWQALTSAGEAMLSDLSQGRLQAEEVVIRPFSELPDLLSELKARAFSGKPLVRV